MIWPSTLLLVPTADEAAVLEACHQLIYGTLTLAVTMFAAFLTLVTHRGGLLGWGSTPLTYCVWLSVVAAVTWRKAT